MEIHIDSLSMSDHYLPGICRVTGDPTAAIDYYSKGVAALEEGIACDVYEVGE